MSLAVLGTVAHVFPRFASSGIQSWKPGWRAGDGNPRNRKQLRLHNGMTWSHHQLLPNFTFNCIVNQEVEQSINLLAYGPRCTRCDAVLRYRGSPVVLMQTIGNTKDGISATGSCYTSTKRRCFFSVFLSSSPGSNSHKRLF